MFRRLAAVALLLTAATGPRAAVPDPSPTLQSPKGTPLNDSERRAVEQGEILVELTAIEGTPVKKAVAVAVIDAPPEDVFAILTNYHEFPEFMPYCRKVTFEGKEGEKSRVRFELEFPWPIGDRYYTLELKNWRFEQRPDGREPDAGIPQAVVLINSWTYVPDSGNIKDTYGSWEVRSYPERTEQGPARSFVRYTVFTDPGGNIPNWANNLATEVAVPKVIHNLRRRVAEARG
jgi:hypothetical protein